MLCTVLSQKRVSGIIAHHVANVAKNKERFQEGGLVEKSVAWFT